MSDQKDEEDQLTIKIENMGCPTSDVAQCAMKDAAPHDRGTSKARQGEEGWLQSKPDKLFRAFSLSPLPGK
jgi:hypothetical protein